MTFLNDLPPISHPSNWEELKRTFSIIDPAKDESVNWQFSKVTDSVKLQSVKEVSVKKQSTKVTFFLKVDDVI